MVAPEEKAPVQALPVNFGKRLAHTDKVVRDKGFKTLKTWLQKHPDLERLEYMKLWKGLYFGMWMADKRPVQQELAVNIALLLDDVPREKRNLWLDTFWETMKDAWEKLDVHRINKYMLFMRIVLAESFKDLRLGGWQLQEVKERAQVLAQSVPKLSNSAPSVGITLQLVRILWDELRPQLGQSPRASQEAVMAFIEPFIALAEWSYVDALVRSIHEHVLRRAPPDLVDALLKRVLEGAAKTDIPKKSRQALYDTADELEKVSRRRPENASPLLKEASPQRAVKAASKAASSSPRSAAGIVSPGPKAGEEKGKKRNGRVKKKNKGGGQLVMSPLMLPQAAVPALRASKKKARRTEAGAVATTKLEKKSKQSATATTSSPTPEATGGTTNKRKVSFDLKATKVVKFRGQQPVTSAKTVKVSSACDNRRTALKKRKP